MNFKIVLYSIILLYTLTTFGQSEIECDLIELAELTINKNPTVKRNELQIQTAQSSLQIQRGVFDYQLSSGLGFSNNRFNLFDADPRNALFEDNFIKTKDIEFSVGLERKFRTGLSTNLSIDYGQLSNNFPINRFDQNVGAFISDHTISSTFSLTQPLIRGRGFRVTTTLEKSSSLRVESAENNFEQTSAFELLQMGVAYWQYLGAYRNLAIFEENEKRVSNVLRITNELVKADKKPAGDLVQIRADLTNQERQTRVAEQNLHNARINLGRSIGLNEEESEQIGLPKSKFPTISASKFNDQVEPKALLKLANEKRKDLRAFEKIQEALTLQLNLAANNRKPQLDLTGFVSYGGMNMGNKLDNALSAIHAKEGRNYEVGARLNLIFPFSNNFARGTYLRNKTAVTDQELAYKDLQRNINLNVNIALNNLKNSVHVLEKAKETLGYSLEVFKNEQLKFKNGLTTLLNLILFQERLTFAQLDYLQAQQQFAVSILNLRYETGTLISIEDNKIISAVITRDLFYTTPNF